MTEPTIHFIPVLTFHSETTCCCGLHEFGQLTSPILVPIMLQKKQQKITGATACWQIDSDGELGLGELYRSE